MLLTHLVLLAIFAANRIVDADEGFYLNAARMISQGMSPYSDFFYTQFVGLPLTFAPFASGGWESFYLMRAFVVLAGLLSAVLLTASVYKITGSGKAAAIALFMYAFSGMSLAWHSTFKVIPFTGLFSLGTFYFWLLFKEKRNVVYIILTGLFLSALISFRSLFAILLPLYIISVIYLSENNKARNLVVMILSLIPLSLPNLIKIFQSLEQFYYGNVFFQLTRDINRSLFDIIYNRIYTYSRVLIDPHLLIICFLAVTAIIIFFGYKKITGVKALFITAEGMIVMNLLLIGLVFLLPHPMARRYVDNYLMFGIIAAVLGLPYVMTWLNEKVKPEVRKFLVYGAVAVYILSLIPYFGIFIFGARDRDRMFRISSVREVTDHIMSISTEKDTVLSEWAGFVFLTGQQPIRYTEIVGYDLGIPLEHEQFIKYNLCDNEYLKEQVQNKTARVAVFQNRPPEYFAALMEENYDRTFETDVVMVYRRK